jgi:hypothetical protein
MVQIIPRQPTKLEGTLGSLNQGLQGIAQGGSALRGALDERRTRQALSHQFGEEFGNIRDPDVRKQMLAGSLQKERDSMLHQFENSKCCTQSLEKNYWVATFNRKSKFI